MAKPVQEIEARRARASALFCLTLAYWAIAASGCTVVLILGTPYSGSRFVLLGLLAVVGAVTECWSVQLSEQIEVSAGGVTIVLAACLVGPFGAAIVGFAQLIPDIGRAPFARWLAHAPLRMCVGLGAGVAAIIAGHNGLFAAIVAATFADMVTDLVGNFGILRVRGADVRRALFTGLQTFYLPFAFYLPVLWAVAVAYQRAGIAAMALVFGPTLLAQYVYRLYQQRGEAYDTLSEANLAFAIGLIRALDASDSYTAGHSAAVGVYARDLARQIGYSARAAAVIQLAALLHDVGKIGVPTEILRKPSRLTDGEWKEIQRHPTTGEQITGEVPVFRYIAEAIRHHHERPDGTGYPDGITAGEIPRTALLIGIVDAYSAMTQPRVYREAREPEEAAAELRRCSGSQFDPDFVESFLAMLSDKSYGYRCGQADDFTIERQRREILSQLGRAGAVREALAAA